MRRWLVPLVLLVASVASAQVGPSTELQLNQSSTLRTSTAPVAQGAVPKKLWSRWAKGEAGSGQVFVSVYHFTVTPGERYTLSAWFKPDGVYRNFYVAADNPLTDVDYSFGRSGNYNKGWVALAQQPSKEKCEEVTRRWNFSISTDSTSNRLYLVVTSQTPGEAVRVRLKSPPDADADVNGNTQDPACAPRKGNTWGQLWSYPVLLQPDPSETAPPKPAAAPPPPADSGCSGLPLNQKTHLTTPATPAQPGAVPKKLWSRWGKGEAAGGQAYLGVTCMALTPGERYTLYTWFKPDGVYRNVYVAGDNPMTDVDYSFGKDGNRGWVVLGQQPAKERCEEVTRRANFTVAPGSTSSRVYLIVTSKTPGETVNVMLRHPADPDADVNADDRDPACPARKGFTWGQAWSAPLLLQLDPSETAGR